MLKKWLSSNYLLLPIMVLACGTAKAQSFPFGIVPDSFARDANAPMVYEMLAARHIGCDTTLTFDELILLYFGAAFRPGLADSDELFNTDSLTALNLAGRHHEALRRGTEMLYQSPSNAEAYHQNAIALHHVGDSSGARGMLAAYYRLISVPYYSGDGSLEFPFWLIHPRHEELILRELEFNLCAVRAEPPLDIVTVFDSLNEISFDIHFHVGLWQSALVSKIKKESVERAAPEPTKSKKAIRREMRRSKKTRKP